MEVTVGPAFHDGLGTTELDFWVISLHKGQIPAAGQAKTQVTKTHSLIFFGESAAGNIESVRIF